MNPLTLDLFNLPYGNAKGEQPTNLQPANLGQKATLREQPTNLQPTNLQPANLGQKATLREQPANLQSANLPKQFLMVIE
ncbi:hypothetical protein BJP36_05695 [Moorena producens JHB]|uniref:Pentapeptide repeat-containing protein n=1 Tax=Moorena producens (strain JHB) TaxID=1454205 RepID=A0A1D9FW34_MOOP1|nr:hypothetical protein [Moorena producens]AOY79484.1 hypothetical protein BJP36_05695 [Moorena producens JHB]